MQWFWPLSWFNHAFLSSCSRKDTHAWPKFSLKDESISMNCALWTIPDRWFESLFIIHIKSIHSLPCDLLGKNFNVSPPSPHQVVVKNLQPPVLRCSVRRPIQHGSVGSRRSEGGNRQVLTQLTFPETDSSHLPGGLVYWSGPLTLQGPTSPYKT